MIINGIELLRKLDSGEKVPEMILIDNDIEEKFIIIEKYRVVGMRDWCYDFNLCKSDVNNGSHEYVGALKASDLLKYKFVIPEKKEEKKEEKHFQEEEINIQEIECFHEYFIEEIKESQHIPQYIKDLARKCDILTKAVKQLDKKLEVK